VRQNSPNTQVQNTTTTTSQPSSGAAAPAPRMLAVRAFVKLGAVDRSQLSRLLGHPDSRPAEVRAAGLQSHTGWLLEFTLHGAGNVKLGLADTLSTAPWARCPRMR